MENYQISEQHRLFNQIIDLKQSIQSMASIVQNKGTVVNDDELNKWNEDVNSLINNINGLKMDVLDFYGKR